MFRILGQSVDRTDAVGPQIGELESRAGIAQQGRQIEPCEHDHEPRGRGPLTGVRSGRDVDARSSHISAASWTYPERHRCPALLLPFIASAPTPERDDDQGEDIRRESNHHSGAGRRGAAVCGACKRGTAGRRVAQGYSDYLNETIIEVRRRGHRGHRHHARRHPCGPPCAASPFQAAPAFRFPHSPASSSSVVQSLPAWLCARLRTLCALLRPLSAEAPGEFPRGLLVHFLFARRLGVTQDLEADEPIRILAALPAKVHALIPKWLRSSPPDFDCAGGSAPAPERRREFPRVREW